MDRTDMIFELLQKLDNKTDANTNTLVRVEKDLKYHIKRTDLLEESIEIKLPILESNIQTRLIKPSLKQVSALLAIIGSAVGTAFKLGWI